MNTARFATAAAIAAALLLLAAAGAGAAALSLRPLDQRYHCGDYFRGHTVRGYLVDVKGTLTHLDYVPPVETLLLWRSRGITAVACQR